MVKKTGAQLQNRLVPQPSIVHWRNRIEAMSPDIDRVRLVRLNLLLWLFALVLSESFKTSQESDGSHSGWYGLTFCCRIDLVLLRLSAHRKNMMVLTPEPPLFSQGSNLACILPWRH